jgi:hypothetical protein
MASTKLNKTRLIIIDLKKQRGMELKKLNIALGIAFPIFCWFYNVAKELYYL